MKKLLLLILLLASYTNVSASQPENMPDTVFDAIVEQVITDSGYFDSVAIEQAISQWLLDQPLADSDGTLLQSGPCSDCSADNQGTDATFPQPRRVKIKAKKRRNGSYTTTYKIKWKKPVNLPANSPYELSHYNVFVSKDGQSYELFEVTPKRKRNGKLRKRQKIKFKDKAKGNYTVQVQAVYVETASINKSKTSTKAVVYVSSGWTNEKLYSLAKSNLYVSDLTGALKVCIENAGYIGTTALKTFTKIDCRNTNLQNSDILQIEDFYNLRSLIIDTNPSVTDISPLKNLPYLSLLSLESNTNINLNLGKIIELTDLYLGNMGLTTLPDLSSQTKLEFLDLSDNQIASGFNKLPDSLTVLKLDNNELSDCNEIANGKTIDTVTLAGINVTSIENCSNVAGLRFLLVSDTQSLTQSAGYPDKVKVEIDKFAGFCGLGFINTNITHLNGYRPIQYLHMLDNTKLFKINSIKSTFKDATNEYPNLIPRRVIVEGSDSMDCKTFYKKKTLLETLPPLDMKGKKIYTKVSGEEKISLACDMTKEMDFKILPTVCKPDLVNEFVVVKDPNSSRYILSWSKQNHDTWGVNNYYVRINGAGRPRKIPADFQLPLAINVSGALANYEIKACTGSVFSSIIGEEGTESCSNWQTATVKTGLDKVTNLNYTATVNDNNATTAVTLTFDYPVKAISEQANHIIPDYFRIEPVFPQPPTNMIIATVAYSNVTSYQSQSINLDDYYGNNYQIKACTNDGKCGATTIINIDPIATSSIVINQPQPYPDGVTFCNAGDGKIYETLKKNDLDTDIDIDYYKVTESQPVANINSKPKPNSYNLVTYFLEADANDRATLSLTRKTNGYYAFSILACIRNREGKDICSNISYSNNCTVNQTINSDSILDSDGSFKSLNDSRFGISYYDDPDNIGNKGIKWYYDTTSPTIDEPDYFYLSKVNLHVGGLNTQTSSSYSSDSCITSQKEIFNINSPSNSTYNYSKYQFTQHYIDYSGTDTGGKYWTVVNKCDKSLSTGDNADWIIKACYSGIGCTQATEFNLGDNTTLPIVNEPLITNTALQRSTDQNLEIIGPDDLSPGLWWNPHQSGTGWYFYWAYNLDQTHEEYGETFDLLAYWVTYRELNGIWTPVWLHSKLKLEPENPEDTGNRFFQGELKYTRYESGFLKNVGAGSIQVLLNSDKTKATLVLNADFEGGIFTQSQINFDDALISGDEFKIRYREDLGNMEIPIEIVSNRVVDETDITRFGSENNSDHYQGAWKYDAAGGEKDDATILIWKTRNLEVIDYFILDDSDTLTGEPLWLQAQTCGSPCNVPTDTSFDGYSNSNGTFGSSYNNLFTISNGFNPLGYTPVVSPWELGNRKYAAQGGRTLIDNSLLGQEKYKKAKIWLDINSTSSDVNGIFREINMKIGEIGNQATMTKIANLHGIDYKSIDVTGNQISTNECDLNTRV